MAVVARVYIVRHGETDHNREGIMQGQLDTPLNGAGVVQARLAADALEDVPFGAAFSSDLRRARKTAEIILENHPDVELETSEALRERFMGDWQGESIARRTDPPANMEPVLEFMARSMKWWNDVVVRRAQRKAGELRHRRGPVPPFAPGAVNRNGYALRQNGRRASKDDDLDVDDDEEVEEEEMEDTDADFEPEHILVVSHGGLIGSLVTNLVGSRRLRAGKGVVIGRCFNASISVIDIDEDKKGRLVSYADTTYLNVDLVQENADVQP